jgi:hypothetical protein
MPTIIQSNFGLILLSRFSYISNFNIQHFIQYIQIKIVAKEFFNYSKTYQNFKFLTLITNLYLYCLMNFILFQSFQNSKNLCLRPHYWNAFLCIVRVILCKRFNKSHTQILYIHFVAL